MKNKFDDIYNHLFCELERLNDEELLNDNDKITAEVQRAKAICDVTEKMTDLARVQLDAVKTVNEYNLQKDNVPLMLQ